MDPFGQIADPESLELEVWDLNDLGKEADKVKSAKRRALSDFLELLDIALEEPLDHTVVLLDRGEIVATGSLSGQVLKCIGIDECFQGMGLSGRIVTHLIREAHRAGRTHLFLFTKPSNIEMFSGLGFQLIASFREKAALLESGSPRIEDYLRSLSALNPDRVESAAVVVNCNPFTLGHRHLIEKASRAHEKLFVFVLEEDLSLFPFAVRLELVKRGTRDLSNVVVLPSGPYVISRATFPSYFLREQDKAQAQAGLDAEIFGSRIAPAASIKKRYVGEEPFCETTRQYNIVLDQVLKEHGLGFEVIGRRKDLEGLAISASRVRSLLKAGDLGALREILPETTFDFLESDAARPIIEKIKGSDSLH